MNASLVRSFTTEQQQQSITSYFFSHPHHTPLHYTTLYLTTLHHHRKTSFLLPPSTVTNQPNNQTRTRTRTMPISWTPHMDQKLLLAVVSTVRLDAEVLVEKWRELFLGMCVIYSRACPHLISNRSPLVYSLHSFIHPIGGKMISVDRDCYRSG